MKTEKRQESPGHPSPAEQGSYVAVVGSPPRPLPVLRSEGATTAPVKIATYNVHRWTGARGGKAFDPSLAADVLAELDADVIALQEVLRPFENSDPLTEIAASMGYYCAFAAARTHKRGELGNAVLSRWPLTSVLAIDLTFGRLERRGALAVQARCPSGQLSVVATHLALVDRTRRRQVRALLDHPRFDGPVLLAGDMNAWRRCAATRDLNDELHHNTDWIPTFPAMRPVLALDRIYARDAEIIHLETHQSPASRRGSDHLPLVAHVALQAGTREGYGSGQSERDSLVTRR
ncbi:hypothetical protein BH23BAC4_BH23BAC4_13010 [soil metagenome]